MGPDPFNMPSFGGAQNFSGQLQQQVSQLAPMATQWHGPIQGAPIAQTFNATSAGSSGSYISKFTHFLGGVASQVGNIAEGAGSWLAKNTVSMAESIPKFAYDFGTGAYDVYANNKQLDRLNSQQENLDNLWKDGKINATQYSQEMKSILNSRNTLTNQINTANKRLAASKVEGIQAASTLVTIATAGAGAEASGGEMAAAQYLKSAGADNFLSGVENSVGKLAESPELFAKLEPAAQKAIQSATAEVVNAGTGASAAQLARATAMNVALKYPIYYNYLSTTGTQIYNQLDNAKYGDAIRTLAFNAALVLSGGPIGQALKYGGKALTGLSDRTFGQTSFWDELSKFYGDGSSDGFAVEVKNMANSISDPEARSEFIKNLSAVEATNVAATGGDAAAAAHRVAQGMQSMYGDGIDLGRISHEDGINDMVNYADAYRLADNEAQRLGLPGVAIGRVDARQLNVISSQVAPAMVHDKDVAKDVWEALKSQNPNQAWSNNANFERQVIGIINRYDSPAEVDNAIRNIKASFNIEGFSSSVSDKLGKMGYIPIKPVNLEAPFKEGSGKILSQFGDDSDFFTKAVKPLPILGYMGDAITSLGLSPNATSQRVYSLFNDNLASNLKETGVLHDIQGESSEQSTDTMIKQLSSYAHNPTRGKIVSKMPITDLRQMTTGDIKAALDVTDSEASDVQKAISEAYMKVPLTIRGMGDRLVDMSYNNKLTGAVQRRYLRVQGAVRFAWNPFFQYLRVIPKTELLSTAEGGGYVSSIFNGHLSEIDGIRSNLRDVGAFDKTGSLGNVISGEATDFGGTSAANLSKLLLKQQERSIAGLVASQADRMGMDAKTYINTFPQNVRDTVQMIAQYDRRSNFLNSPLARTLNVAVFPFRFDAKVAGILTRSLARTAPLTQVAVVNGILRAHDWLNSEEGMQWYSRNSDAIGLFKYITPVATFAEIFSSLLPGHDHSLGNFGELGGLPFGWIPQVLDAEGLTQFNQPGVDPKTGDTYSENIPTTMKGQMGIAIQDLINSLFSYPGATVGLPSKNKISQSIAFGFVGAKKGTDTQSVTPQISAQQQNFSQAVQAANPQPAGQNMPGFAQSQIPKNQQATPYIPQTTQTPGQSVPRLPSQLDTMPGKQSSSSSPKKKKADYTPYLLPGQTQLGQL